MVLQNFGGKADGGRIGFAGGTPISFSRQEKSYLFRRLVDLVDLRIYTMLIYIKY